MHSPEDACVVAPNLPNPPGLMFDRSAFRSWALVFIGASLFALLFVVLMLLVEHVTGGRAEPTRAVVAIGGAAFVGYVGTAWIIRQDRPA